MKLTDEQLAELKYALVKTMEDVPQELIDKISLNLDTLDTSLRGLVMALCQTDDVESVWWACDEGIAVNVDASPDYTWDEIREMGWTVRALTPEDIGYRVRKWNELSEEEQYSFQTRRHSPGNSIEHVYKSAIDIATRGNA